MKPTLGQPAGGHSSGSHSSGLRSDETTSPDHAMQLIETLATCEALFSTRINRTLRPLKLNYSKFRLLEILADSGDNSLSATTIALQTGSLLPKIVKALRPLETEGWIMSRPDERDLRITKYAITTAGQQVHEAARTQTKKVLEDIVAGLEVLDQRTAIRVLRTMVANLDEN